MNVLFTCFSQSWGGMEMFALTTVKQLRKFNVDVELACFPNSRLHTEAVKENIRVNTFKQSGYFHFIETLNLSSLIKHNRYSIIECGGSKDLWLVVPALKIAGLQTPLFLSKQMASFIVKKDFLHRWIYNRVTKVFAISNMVLNNLMETTPLTLDKLVLLHNAIDTSKFDPAIIDSNSVRNEFEVSKDQILIGMIARFSHGKGHEEFLKAAKIILQKYNHTRFLVVGEASRGEEDYANSIKALSKSLELGNKVIFAGFRKDVPQVINALDIFVFPSHDEAFGIALAEALSMAKPSVCSNYAGVLDLAVDELTSLLFEKGNHDDLAKKIEMLIQTPEKRKAFGLAARKRAIEMFDLNIFTKKLIAHYEDSLK